MKRFTPIAILLAVAGLGLAAAASAQQAAPPTQYIFPAKGHSLPAADRGRRRALGAL